MYTVCIQIEIWKNVDSNSLVRMIIMTEFFGDRITRVRFKLNDSCLYIKLEKTAYCGKYIHI